MDHPIRSEKAKSLRGRVVQLLKTGFSAPRQSNIVFVCGGNKTRHMRRRFQKEFSNLLAEYEFFEPEFAMENYFTLGDTEPFNIADFEALVGELSIAIVIFPEGPGSFAELGYFSTQDKLASKVVLALDSNHQKSGSFISLGPASKIAKASIFQLPIQLDYKKPDFELVSTRIKEHARLRERRRNFEPQKFSDLTSFELFALIQTIVELLVIATGDDIESILRGMFGSRVTPSKIKKIISILIGSERLKEVGKFEHLALGKGKPKALSPRDGMKTRLTEVSLEISALLFAPDSGFSKILEELDKC
ncbi:retron St85 family effector protein [Roseibium polysiphoniae]|uniref:retron St85 family effector protein n=1 Tax=Roseibium polysiphoniae TaxID=2571221 RepID=UPI00329910B1